MSAQDNLSSELFHGTAVPFSPGDSVIPQGAHTRESIGSGEHTYATSNLHIAKKYALMAAGEMGDDAVPRVFHVEPQGTAENDPHSKNSVRVKGSLKIIKEVM